MVDHLKYLTISVVAFTLYIIIVRSNRTIDDEVYSTVRSFYYSWNSCITRALRSIRRDPNALWDNIGRASEYCENYTEISHLQILEYPNRDESKYHILPNNHNDFSAIVTIGVGHDIDAEKKIKQDLGNNSVFYGADPIPDINAKLFESIGIFYPFAISGKSGYSQASVLEKNGHYSPKDVIQVDLIYFLKEIIEPSLLLYDNLWIDAEGGEYSMMPLFYRGGRLDQNNITVCQFNMEVHSPNELQKKTFRDFIDQILLDERYAFTKLSSVAGHRRMYFINMDNDVCSRKYLVKITV